MQKMGMPHGIRGCEDQIRFVDVRAWSIHGMSELMVVAVVVVLIDDVNGLDGQSKLHACMRGKVRWLRVCVCGRMDRRINSEFRGGGAWAPRSCNQILKCIDAIHSSSSRWRTA